MEKPKKSRFQFSLTTFLLIVFTIVSGISLITNIPPYSVASKLPNPGIKKVPLAFSPDGNLVALSGNNLSVDFYNSYSGKKMYELKKHTWPVSYIKYSPDGSKILTSSKKEKITYIWDTNTQKEIFSIAGTENSGGFIEISLKNTVKYLIITDKKNNCFSTYEFKNKQLHELFKNKKFPSGFWPYKTKTGFLYITNNSKGKFEIWDQNGQSVTHNLQLPNKYPPALGFTPDGQNIVTNDNLINTRNIRTGKKIFSFSLIPSRPPPRATLCPETNMVLVDYMSGLNLIVNIITGEKYLTLSELSLRFISFSTNLGKCLASSRKSKEILVFDVNTGKILNTLKKEDGRQIYGSFSFDGNLVALAHSGHFQFWDLTKDSLVPAPSLGNVKIQWGIFSPVENKILLINKNRSVIIYDLQSYKITPLEILKHIPAWEFRFTPDGKEIVSFNNREFILQRWDVNTGKLTSLNNLNYGHIEDAAFSYNSKLLATFDEKDLTPTLWEATTGEKIDTFIGHKHFVTSIEFAPKTNKVLTGSLDKTARIWEPNGKIQPIILRGHTAGINSAKYSSDGKFIVTASNDHTARLWNAESGQEIHILKGNPTEVKSAAFSPNGKKVITVGADGTTRIFNTNDGLEIAVLNGSTEIQNADFTHDDQSIITKESNQTTRIVNAKSGIEKHNFAGVPLGYNTSSKNLLVAVKDDSGVTIYKRNRQEEWWGIFYLPGFWLTGCFLIILPL